MRARVSDAGRGASFTLFLGDAFLPSALFKGGEESLESSEEDKQTSPHTQGTSAVQFILTSSIVIHTLDQLRAVYINMFSCKEFDPKVAEQFSVKWFGAGDCSARFIDRV